MSTPRNSMSIPQSDPQSALVNKPGPGKLKNLRSRENENLGNVVKKFSRIEIEKKVSRSRDFSRRESTK